MKMAGSILGIVVSFGMLVIYLFNDDIHAAVTAIWILLLWIFVSGIQE